MNEAKLYELFGRKVLDFEVLHGEYRSLLGVLRRVCSGEIEPGRVVVDEVGLTWRLEPDLAEAKNGARGT